MKERKTKEYLLSEEDIKKVKKSEKDFREKLIFEGLLYTGFRIGEFIHMNNNWISDGRITVPNSDPCNCKNCNGKWSPKTDSAVRTIPYLPEAKEVIEPAFEVLDDGEKLMSITKSRSNAWQILNKLEKRTGIDLFNHALRGTMALTLAKKGMDPYTLKDFMGWSSINTAAYYVKLAGSDLEEKTKEIW